MNGFYYYFINKIITLIIKTHFRIVYFAFESLYIFQINISVERTGFIWSKKKNHSVIINIIYISFNILFNRAPQLQRFWFWTKKRENIQIKFKSDRSHYKTLIDRFSASSYCLPRPPYPIIIKMSLKQKTMIVLFRTFFCQLIVIKPQIGSFLLFPCIMIWFHLRNVFIKIRRKKNRNQDELSNKIFR